MKFDKKFQKYVFPFLIPLLYINPIVIQAQSLTSAKICGRVTDASTGEPLHFANVFLANTTKGDATNEHGFFCIPKIPLGRYEIFASMMGYETEKKTIIFSNSQDLMIDFNLKPKILEMQEVTVSAEDAKEWRKNLKIFERVFFGLKEFAKQCKLLNPEILDFKYDKDSGLFEAIAEGPLQFVNNALGYEITFFLDEFNAKLYNDNIYTVDPVLMGTISGSEYKRGSLKRTGTATYRLLIPKNEKENKKWKRNRIIAYNGSLRHFFKSMVEGSLIDEGFKIYGAKSLRGSDDYKVKPDTLLQPGLEPSQHILSFPNLLKVIYTREEDKIKYQISTDMLTSIQASNTINNREFDSARSLARIAAKCKYQESWLEIIKGFEITILTDGIKIPGLGEIGFYGYWGWEGPSEWLPQDYEPLNIGK